MIENLRERYLYEALPDGLINLDEQGIIEAITSALQDRVEDLRSFAKKFELLYGTAGLPDSLTVPNVVLVDLVTSQGRLYTRSLDISAQTPGTPGMPAIGYSSAALTAWAVAQLGVDDSEVSNVRYGLDRLRFVDANTLDYLAASIGAVLYQTAAQSEGVDKTRILESYFPRLKIKGTAASFEVLGRILGFDDVRMTPLWGRLSPRLPADVGSGTNAPDFSALPDYYPQQVASPFYDPNKLDDGPFFSWSGTCSSGTGASDFYTSVVNDFNPWVNVVVSASATGGTIMHPADGTYVLGGDGDASKGGPHKKAYVRPENAGILFQAIAEGESFNGLVIQVASSGANKVLSITDRLSAIKYRTSYFDLGLTATFERVEEIQGTSAARKNTDLAVAPHTQANYGTEALSPYRAWMSGSITTGLATRDFLTSTGTQAPQVVTARVQASGTDRQLNTEGLLAAGAQVVQSLEEVRPATRFPLRSAVGFLLRDSGSYAPYPNQTLLFTTSPGITAYTGTATGYPDGSYQAGFHAVQNGTVAVVLTGVRDTQDESIAYYAESSGRVSAAYYYGTHGYAFTTLSPYDASVQIIADWTTTTTEVVRSEPDLAVKQAGTYGWQARPEDDSSELVYEMADDYPWLRDIVAGGELVETDSYVSTVAEAGTHHLEDQMSVKDQTGAEYSVFAVESAINEHLRIISAARDTHAYVPAQIAVGYRGQFKDLSTLSADDVALVNTKNDLETLMEPGYALYHVGLVQGVLVGDPTRFFSPAHRDSLVAWLPFNEHVDADLEVLDHSTLATAAVLSNALYTDRQWDSRRGWYFRFRNLVQAVAIKNREIGQEYTLSFWIKPDAVPGSGVSTILRYGPISFDLDHASATIYAYVNNADGQYVPVGYATLSTSDFTFVYVRVSELEAVLGIGSLDAAAVETVAGFEDFAAFVDTDTQLLVQGGERTFGFHDLRVWSVKKTSAEMEQIRAYAPVATQVNYPLCFVYTANRQERYALRVLDSGYVVPDVMPAWVRMTAQKRVVRYDSMGRFHGEPRRKEVGLGGGRYPFSGSQLGQQYFPVTGAAQIVAAPATGAVPGTNELWAASSSSSGTYLILSSGSTLTGTVATGVWSGTSVPWPNLMVETNPVREYAWVKGDDGFVYQIKLKPVGTETGAEFEATKPVRSRSDAELILSDTLQVFASTGSVYAVTPQGTIYPGQLQVTAGASFSVSSNAATGEVTVLTNGTTEVQILHPLSLRDAEQPTGAQVELSANGTVLSVANGSRVYVKTFSGTNTSPPLWMYLDTRTIADVPDAYQSWTEKGNTAMLGETLSPKIAARANKGLLEFENTGSLPAGYYRLRINSGNIGRLDDSFDGFRVEVNLNETVLERRLLKGCKGYNIRGTDEFEFELADGVLSGTWLLSLNWLNDFDDPVRGTKRQLAIYGYVLERLQTELYKVTIPGSGTVPQVDYVATETFYGSVAGGWMAYYNSYGTVASWQHESKIYTANDTVESNLPVSSRLTATTYARRSDIIIVGTNVVIADDAVPSLPSFGIAANGSVYNPPTLLSVSNVTASSARITATVTLDTAALQGVCSVQSNYANPVFSAYFVANAQNGHTAIMPVSGLAASTTYYYTVATGGSIYYASTSQFTTA